MTSWDVRKPRQWVRVRGREREPLVFLFLLGIILPSEKSLCSHCEDRKMKSSWVCLSHKLLHGSLWYKGMKLSETCKSIHITGPENTTNDILVSLTLPSCSTVHRFYINCTCLGRALHTAGLPGGGLPSHPHTYTYLCSLYLDATTKIYQFPFKTWTDCHPTCISSPWESLQLAYKYLEKYVNVGQMISK